MKKSGKNDWYGIFGIVMKEVFSFYKMTDREFHDKTKCDASTAKHWKLGDRFPSNDNFELFSDYLRWKSNSVSVNIEYLFKQIEHTFHSEQYGHIYTSLIANNIKTDDLVIQILKYCIDAGKGRIMDNKTNEYPSQNKTLAIVFDFDGTLTRAVDPIVKTTWENIWTALGYNVRECQKLHKRFDLKEISHETWCQLTEDKFKVKKLQKEVLYDIADKIQLIDGVEETFKELRKRDIKIYIVSGSIQLIIQTVLGPLNEYVDTIRANVFRFDEEGYLKKIVGTKYDFEGKADYIRIIANDLQI